MGVIIEPALEGLRHRVDTRIFQEKTVPEILEEVLGKALSDYHRSVELRLERTYPPCDYRVQYDESDFRFCERLMEEEGIVYFFEAGDVETLVLSDALDAYGKVSTIHDDVIVHSEYSGGTGGIEVIKSLNLLSQVRPTKVSKQLFDWTKPSVPVEGESSPLGSAEGVGATLPPDREIYEHDEDPLTSEPGGTTYGSDSEDRIRLAREQQVWDARVAAGRSTVLDMRPGAVFEIIGHPRADLDGKYLLISVKHTMGGASEGFGRSAKSYQNEFQCIPAGTVYRPKQRTSRPRINSVQTAIVVGPSGEEVHTDEHGRIRVQFHWDRLGENDDHSSCWIRVMQPWGGAGWGFVFIPRIGMEVIVSFVNGDPDRPMVIGSVYNGENSLPYTLPDEKTKSTIKTNSSLGGDGFNEFRFEDKAGEEEIYIHAQKDFNEQVLNDHNTQVDHDQTNTVDNDQTEHVKHDQFLTVDNNRDKTVKVDETTIVEGSRTETVKKDETITIEGDRTETVKGDEEITVEGDQEITVKGDREEEVKGDEEVTVKGKVDLKVKGNHTTKIDKGKVVKVKSGYAITVDKGIIAKAKKKIILKAGKSSITLKSDGTIEIKGKTIKVEGEKAKATFDGSEAKIEGPKVDVKGDDGVKLDGAKVDSK